MKKIKYDKYKERLWEEYVKEWVKKDMEINLKKWIKDPQTQLHNILFENVKKDYMKRGIKKDARNNPIVRHGWEWWGDKVEELIKKKKEKKKEIIKILDFTIFEFTKKHSRKYRNKTIIKIVNFILEKRKDIKNFRKTEMKHKSYSAVKSKIIRTRKLLEREGLIRITKHSLSKKLPLNYAVLKTISSAITKLKLYIKMKMNAKMFFKIR